MESLQEDAEALLPGGIRTPRVENIENADLDVVPGDVSYRFTLARRKYGKPSPDCLWTGFSRR